MNNSKGETNPVNNDYFADRLLAKLDTTDPITAAYEAQDVSREVGFDFNNFQDVVPRAMDEIREAKEAYEEGEEGKEHFGDEVADIMFSLINLARHAGEEELPEFANFETEMSDNHVTLAPLVAIDDIGAKIQSAAKTQLEAPDTFKQAIKDLFNDGMKDTIDLAKSEGFNPRKLLETNVRKYLIRCQAIEKLASEDGKTWHDLAGANEIVAYWKRAKTQLK